MSPEPSPAPAVVASSVGGEAENVERYDRQIRLWGFEAQRKLRGSSVLLSGLSGLGAEVLKNLMLCGLKSMTIMDDQKATTDDKLSNFFLDDDYLGKNRALACQAKAADMNPDTQLTAIEGAVEEKEEQWLEQFDLVIVLDRPYSVLESMDAKCRSKRIRFIGGCVFGWTGFAFFDFDGHKFRMKVPKPAAMLSLDGAGEGETVDGPVADTIEEDVYEQRALEYGSWCAAWNVDWLQKKWLRKTKFLLPQSYFPIRAMLSAQCSGLLTGEEEKDLAVVGEQWREELNKGNHVEEMHAVKPDKFDYLFGPQLTAVCAIVGGVLAQEAITALSEGDQPLRNVFVYSALDTSGHVMRLPPV